MKPKPITHATGYLIGHSTLLLKLRLR